MIKLKACKVIKLTRKKRKKGQMFFLSFFLSLNNGMRADLINSNFTALIINAVFIVRVVIINHIYGKRAYFKGNFNSK